MNLFFRLLIVLLLFSGLSNVNAYNNSTSGVGGIDLDISANNESVSDFINNDTGIVEYSDLFSSYTRYTSGSNISYSGPLNNVKFGYKTLNMGIFPVGFYYSYSLADREEYLIDNVCKNSGFDIDYNSYSNDEIYIDDSVLEGTLVNDNKAFVVCAKQNGNYGAYSIGYTLNKNLAVDVSGFTSYNYDEVYGNTTNYNISFRSVGIWSNHYFGYYIDQDGNSNCSNNVNDYDTELYYYNVSSDSGEIIDYTAGNGNKFLNICFGAFRSNGNLVQKASKQVKFSLDNNSPLISLNGYTWDDNTWYGGPNWSDKTVKVVCDDPNIIKCEVQYGDSTFYGPIGSGNSEIDILLDKEGDNTIKVISEDIFGNSSTMTKSYKKDTVRPNVSVYITENVINKVITSIDADFVCSDYNGSGCNEANQVINYASNNTYSVTYTDNLNNSITQVVDIFNVGKTLSNWFGNSYTGDIYGAVNISGNITSCGSPSFCDRNSTSDNCSIFQASINPVSSNGYDVYSSSGFKYKTNHRFAAEAPAQSGKIMCQYYDGVTPTFNIQNKLYTANDSNIVYLFDGLTEVGSGIRNIDIDIRTEDGTLTTVSTIINSLSEENQYKAGILGIDLGLNYKDVTNFDNDLNGYGKIDLTIKISDWAGNEATKTDSIYIIPGEIDLSKSLTVTSIKANPLSTALFADGSYYEYYVNLQDQFGNPVKSITGDANIPDRIIGFNRIVFTNTTDFYNHGGYPVSYKWPNTFIWDDSGVDIKDISGLTSSDFVIKVRSLVPTEASNYSFGRGDIQLQELIVNDSYNISFDLADNNYLVFYPPVRAEITNTLEYITDNTNHNLEFLYTKDTNEYASINDVNFIFSYTNYNDLNKRFKLNNIIKYEKNQNFNFSLDYPNSGEGSENYIINIDTNGEGFDDPIIRVFLKFDSTSVGGFNTAYQILEYAIGSDSFLTRSIDILGLTGLNSNSEGTTLLDDSSINIIVDNQQVDKAIIKRNISKNVIKYTKSIPNSVTFSSDYVIDLTNPSFVLNSGEKIFYYDFTGVDECNNTYNTYNKGCLVKLLGDVTAITGKNNIIIKGGNLVIDTDMYYADENSMIGYYVFRDSETETNGGNIYITPEPTNINGILYADGSVISVDDSNIVKMYDYSNIGATDLNKQLLWYGSIISANTIGGTVNFANVTDKTLSCPYGTDAYVGGFDNLDTLCTIDETSKYDLSNLRRFSSRVGNLLNCDGSYYGINGVGTKIINSFVGRKTCFGDVGNINLMDIDNYLSTFIVKYDPQIQVNPLIIISD